MQIVQHNALISSRLKVDYPLRSYELFARVNAGFMNEKERRVQRACHTVRNQ